VNERYITNSIRGKNYVDYIKKSYLTIEIA